MPGAHKQAGAHDPTNGCNPNFMVTNCLPDQLLYVVGIHGLAKTALTVAILRAYIGGLPYRIPYAF